MLVYLVFFPHTLSVSLSVCLSVCLSLSLSFSTSVIISLLFKLWVSVDLSKLSFSSSISESLHFFLSIFIHVLFCRQFFSFSFSLSLSLPLVRTHVIRRRHASLWDILRMKQNLAFLWSKERISQTLILILILRWFHISKPFCDFRGCGF